jgi:hypothetical protein
MAKATSGSEKPAKKTRATAAKPAGDTAEKQSAAPKQPTRSATAKKTAGAAKKPAGSATPLKTHARGKAAAGTGASDTASAGASVKAGKGGKAPGGSPASKTAKASGGAAAKKTAAKTPSRARSGVAAKAEGGAPDLRAHMRHFASARTEGWGHDDWLAFLDELHGRGHDVSDHHAIGRQLESERLSLVLERMPELSPPQVSALVERFETLWSLRNAQASELAEVRGVSGDLAERVLEAVRQG